MHAYAHDEAREALRAHRAHEKKVRTARQVNLVKFKNLKVDNV